ncbi:hypothetical protein CSB93_7006 (plasmid) [Pseudomonas paraeruginosa]|uniref:Uncharacterized protein n=1 Tax=Pseudomonas paraeruginosa TaxID=2994495 RepID=A0A2R3IKV7_9PSED|nr:hypothetical protein CSB93_7006 [Pseudomonas paraeruginosa]AWE88887.1 hypothetical protein CSC28_7069 [Pseudomonas paraeruginosa]
MGFSESSQQSFVFAIHSRWRSVYYAEALAENEVDVREHQL